MNPSQPEPWWKFGHVWLVVAGPALVVAASFVTLYLAITRPDPLVSEDYYRQGMEINKTLDKSAANLVPAELGRNHAATGLVPAPLPQLRRAAAAGPLLAMGEDLARHLAPLAATDPALRVRLAPTDAAGAVLAMRSTTAGQDAGRRPPIG
jgi:hypothetical protein